MRNKAKVIASMMLTAILSGCGTLHTVAPTDTSGQGSLFRRFTAALFTRASMGDMQLTGVIGELNADAAGVIANTAIQVTVSDPARAKQLQAALQFAIASGLIEPVGPRVVEFKLSGETAPRLLLCKVAIAGECALAAPNAPYRVYAHPVGAGLYTVWVVDRLVKL